MENDEHNLLALSDYSLLHIFTFLSSTDLYHLSLTCRRFEALVTEKKFWYRIDGREGPNEQEKLNYFVNRLNKHTSEFLVCCDKRDTPIVPGGLLSLRDFPHLTVLALENQLIRGDLANLSQYPKSLVELSLRKSFVHSHSTFFKLSYLHMDNLKVLILDECGWVETYMLVPMSKYPKLEVLSLYQCKKLSDNDVAYLSLAGCFGFKQLRVLDVRHTGLGDQILKTFYKHLTLHELYFQNYVTTFALDKAKRRLQIAHGSPMKPYPYFSEYDDVADTHLPSMERAFGYHFYRTTRRQNITNHGTVMYKFVVPNLDVDYETQSVLYRPPYGECRCPYRSRLKPSNVSRSDSKLTKVKTCREEINKWKNIIKWEKYKKCRPCVYVIAPKFPMDPHKNETDISSLDEPANKNNKKIDWINVREPTNELEIAMFEHADIHSFQMEAASPTVIRTFDCFPSVFVGPRVRNPGPGELSDDTDEEEIGMDRVLVVKNSGIVVEEVYEDGENSYEEAKPSLKGNTFEKEASSEDSGVKSEDSEVLHKEDSKTEHNEAGGSSKCKSDYKQDDPKPSASKACQTYKKCKICDIEIAEDDTKCRNHKDVHPPITRKSKVNHWQRLPKQRDENRTVRGTRDNFKVEYNFPSTSKDEKEHWTLWPSTSSKKRAYDTYADASDTKKFKASSDNEDELSDLDYDLNISYKVKNVKERGRSPNMFFIDIHNPEGDLLNAPVGGGLINILLGGDAKTRTSIKKLSLRGYTRITDCTLDYLNTLKLDLLDVTKTGVSRKAVASFIRQNPACRVLHESACTCLPNIHL